MSLEQDDKAAAEVAIAPRVTLADLEANIIGEVHFRASHVAALHERAQRSLETLSLCVLVTRNGFTLVGKSAPASPENFNAELGKKIAREDALRQLWPLMGYALRDKPAASK